MISDRDIWAAELLMTQCFQRDAAVQPAMCADELPAAGEVNGCAVWKPMAAIERLQATAPAEGELLH